MEAQPKTSLSTAELETQRLPLSEVTKHPQNPRTHSDRQIKELQSSLLEHGYAAGSMTVQRSTMRLVKGHGVYEALLGLGCIDADFVVADMTDAEALLFLARDNRLSDLSAFDVPKLKAITVELQKIDVPLERIGFNEGELKSLESDWAKSEADNRVVEEDDPPEVSEDEPITQTGDLWHLGDHRVLCADSTCAEDVERVMGGEKADALVSDPPYNVGKPIANDSLTAKQYREFSVAWLDCVPASVGVLISFHSPQAFPPLLDAARSAGWTWGRMLWFWKPGTAFGVVPWHGWARRSECILVMHNDPDWPAYVDYHADMYAHKKGDGGTEDAVDDQEVLHPTLKPLWIVADLIAHTTGLIYDPFLGSGTTLIAADQLDRVCYGLEIAHKYCDVIVQRYINHVGNSDNVWVERDGQKLTWEQRNMGRARASGLDNQKGSNPAALPKVI